MKSSITVNDRDKSLGSEETIFSAALELGSAGERAAYLDEACAGNVLLRMRIELLLNAQLGLGDFMEAVVPTRGAFGLPKIVAETHSPQKVAQFARQENTRLRHCPPF